MVLGAHSHELVDTKSRDQGPENVERQSGEENVRQEGLKENTAQR